MIPGDEGKKMSILELISDEPIDADTFIDYTIKNLKEYRAYWEDVKNDIQNDSERSKEEASCTIHQIDSHIVSLECIKSKLSRMFLMNSKEAKSLYDYLLNAGYISHEFHQPVHDFFKRLKEFVK